MADNGDILESRTLETLLGMPGSSGPTPAPPAGVSPEDLAAFKAELIELVEGRLSPEKEAAALARAETSPYWIWLLRGIVRAVGAVDEAPSPIEDRREAIVDRVLTDLQSEQNRPVVTPAPEASASWGARFAAAARENLGLFRRPAFAGALGGLAVLVVAVGTLVDGGGAGTYFAGDAAITANRLRTRSIEAINRPLRAGDGFRVDFSLQRDAHVTFWNVDSQGAVNQIYPSKGSLTLQSGQYSVPAEGEWFVLDGKPGTETILILAGARPVDPRAFAAAVGRAWFYEGGLDLDRVQTAASSFGQRVQIKQFKRD
ncbi:MAG: DUF4384 domain-containing protein [Myxococcales bacterium]|nr:DUF4384 domain-containing protein [Myxococcales bacterium]